MPLMRDNDGHWTLEVEEDERATFESSHESYQEALPRYLNALDPVFRLAKQRSEVNFIWSMLAIREMADAGWDPYETTQNLLSSVQDLNRSLEGEIAVHLALWIYGHSVEASEAYEFLGNLIDIIAGGRFSLERFPSRNGLPISPSEKLNKLEQMAQDVGMPEAVVPMREAWNRNFRNAIFHADYSLYGIEVRTLRLNASFSRDLVLTLVNRALASQEALSVLRAHYRKLYEEPVRIPGDPDFGEGDFVVMVREGFGVVGLRDAWTEEEIRRGRVSRRIGRFTPAEMKALESDDRLVFFPSQKET